MNFFLFYEKPNKCLNSKHFLNLLVFSSKSFLRIEAVAWRCFIKNSWENTCVKVAFLIKKKRLWHRCYPMSFSEIFKNNIFSRTPPVAAFVSILFCKYLVVS